MWRLQGLGGGLRPHVRNIPRLNKKKMNGRNSSYLITLLKYYELQTSKIVYYVARGRNCTFHVECDVSSTNGRRRVLYSSHEKSTISTACCISYFSKHRFIKSMFCLCERGDIEGIIKNFEKKILEKKFWKILKKKIFPNKNMDNKNLWQH